MANLDPGVHVDGLVGGLGLAVLIGSVVGAGALDGKKFGAAIVGALALGWFGVLFAENVWEYYYPPSLAGGS
jgi:hypothetical protein